MSELNLRLVERALQAEWQATFSERLPTAYPGVPFRSQGCDVWAELWLASLSGVPARGHGLARVEVLATVHLFARPQLSPAQSEAWRDELLNWLRHRVVRVPGELSSDGTAVAWLRLFEPEARDWSRDAGDLVGGGVRHFVLTVPGQAHEAEVVSAP